MCSWAINAVIEHYNMQGQAVYGCTADMSKAFDVIEWVPLFKELMSRGVAPVFLRVLLYIYVHQTCDVRWNGDW